MVQLLASSTSLGRGGNKVINQQIIDVHTHCFTGRWHADSVMRRLAGLRTAGLRNMVVAGLINNHLNVEAMASTVSDFVDNHGGPTFNEVDDLLALAAASDGVILPFLEITALWGDVPALLHDLMPRGFKGIKGIYIPDEENDLGVNNMPALFGISLQRYQQREWEVFDFAQMNDLPVLYHIDARRYGDVLKALLDDFPRMRIVIAHLGIGRKAFSAFLDSYPHIFTDIASLLPHIRGNPGSYRDFIIHYADQVCFGSDTMLYAVEKGLDYIELVRELKLPEEVEYKVFSANPARFLGSALPD
jgi:hypothetical protein